MRGDMCGVVLKVPGGVSSPPLVDLVKLQRSPSCVAVVSMADWVFP
jgi:hypothetical protein